MQTCRTCGAKYPDAGDGYDGECPDCADRTAAALEEECIFCNHTPCDCDAQVDSFRDRR